MAVIDEALETLAGRFVAYDLYRDYYRGRHRLAFATSKFREAFGDLFSAFSDNLCRPTVQAVVDRLDITGFGVEEIGDDDAGDDAGSALADALSKAAWRIWLKNRLDFRATRLHRETLWAGEAYLIVWPDAAGTARFHIHSARSVVVRQDEEAGEPLWAVKVWRERRTGGYYYRLNIYYPDRTERLIGRDRQNATALFPRDAKSFAFLSEADSNMLKGWSGEAEQNGVSSAVIDNPYGRVPVFAFANDADIGEAGESVLSDAIPIQDALNKSVADMLVAMEFVSYPQRYGIGVEGETETEGGVIGKRLEMGINRLITVASDTARFGDFATADLEQFVKVSDSFRVEMARVTGTPLHYMALMTEAPSGEALQKLDGRLVKRAESCTRNFGAVWADAMAFALEVEGRARRGVDLKTEWAGVNMQSAKEVAEAVLVRKQIGLDDVTALEEIGVPRQEAERMAREKQVARTALVASFNGSDNSEAA